MRQGQDVASEMAIPIKPPGCHIVAIIGARGGSKSLPKKNIRQFFSGKLIWKHTRFILPQWNSGSGGVLSWNFWLST